VAPHFPLIAPERFAAEYRVEDIPLPKLRRAEDRVDHPWIDALRNCFGHDAYFDDELRRRALLSYAALCGFMAPRKSRSSTQSWSAPGWRADGWRGSL
jgi:choline-sulfatase